MLLGVVSLPLATRSPVLFKIPTWGLSSIFLFEVGSRILYKIHSNAM